MPFRPHAVVSIACLLDNDIKFAIFTHYPHRVVLIPKLRRFFGAGAKLLHSTPFRLLRPSSKSVSHLSRICVSPHHITAGSSVSTFPYASVET
jgi:hypothetical protein